MRETFALLMQRDHVFVLSAQLSYSILRFVTFIVLARSLPKDEMGQVMFAINYVLIFIFIGTLGLDTASVHFAAKFKAEGATERLRRLSQHTMLIALAGGTLLSIIGILVASLSFKLLTFSENFVFLLSVPFALLQMYGLGILLGLHELSSYSTLFVAQPMLFILSISGLNAIGQLNVMAVALTLWMSYAVTAAGVLWRTTRHVSEVFSHWQVCGAELREQTSFSLFIYINLIGLFLNSRWPILVMGWLGHVEQIAYYSLSTPITEASLQVARSVGLVLLARASAGHQPARARFWGIISLYILATALLIIVAPWIIPWLFGHDYKPAALLIQVLAPGMIPLAGGILYVSTQAGLGRPRIGAIAAIASFAVMMILSAFLVPLYSSVGAAIATVLAYTVYCAVAAFLSRNTW